MTPNNQPSIHLETVPIDGNTCPVMLTSNNYSYDVCISKESFMSTLSLLCKYTASEVSQKRIDNIENNELQENVSASVTADYLVSSLRELRENSLTVNPLMKSREFPFVFILNGSANRDSERTLPSHKFRKVCITFKEYVSILHVKSLYRFDFTSPLYQLAIGKYLDNPGKCVNSDVEARCLMSASTKSTSIICLRERHPVYPITFKGWSGKNGCAYVHQYKFTRIQKAEFMSRVNTGLNKRSRILFKKMKPCKVKLNLITKTDIKRWVCEKEMRVLLKPLSIEEISYWIAPKTTITSEVSGVCVDWLATSSSYNTSCSLNSHFSIPHIIRHDLDHISITGQIFAGMRVKRRTI